MQQNSFRMDLLHLLMVQTHFQMVSELYRAVLEHLLTEWVLCRTDLRVIQPEQSKINDGINTLGNSTGSLASDATRLNNGAKSLGKEELVHSAKEQRTLDDGAATLKSGVDKVNSGASNLKDGASKVNAGAKQVLWMVQLKQMPEHQALKMEQRKVNAGASSLKDGAKKSKMKEHQVLRMALHRLMPEHQASKME